MAAALHRLGAFSAGSQSYTTQQIMTHCDIVPRYRRVLRSWLDSLIQHDMLSCSDDRYSRLLPPTDAAQQSLAKQTLDVWPDLPELVGFVTRTGEALTEIVTGRYEPLEILFPGGSFTVAEKLYRDSPHARFYNGIISKIVASLAGLLPRKPLTVLEIGAGTGSTTAAVLPVLPPNSSYDFADISETFLASASNKFERFPFIRYRRLDIDDKLEDQGFHSESYDLVIAANVLHVTKNPTQALHRVRSLLATDGLLVLWELTRAQPWFDLTFGLLIPELGDTNTRGHQPLLESAVWQRLLLEAGFKDTLRLPESEDNHTTPAQHIIVAANAHQTENHPITDSTGAIHPLLSVAMESPKQTLFTFTQRQSYLQDHKIAGRSIIPAAAIIEAGLAAGRQKERVDEFSLSLADLHFTRMFKNGENIHEAKMAVEHAGDKHTFSLVRQTRKPGRGVNAWTVYATGSISAPAAAPSNRMDLKMLRARCREELDTTEFYAELDDRGLNYGTGFRGIQQLFRGNGEALARMMPSLTSQPDAAAYHLHPTLLDACFHPLAAALSKTTWNQMTSPLVPIAIERFQLFSHPQGDLWSHVQLNEHTAATDSDIRGGITIFDSHNRLIATVQGLQLAPLGQGSADVSSNQLVYQLDWLRSRQSEVANKLPAVELRQGENWLIVTDSTDVAEGIVTTLQSHKCRCTLLTPSEISTGSDRIFLGLGCKQDSQNTVGRCLERPGDFDHIVYCCGLDVSFDSTDFAVVAQATEQACSGLLQLIQALIKTAEHIRTKLWVVRSGAQATGLEQTINPAQAPLWGLSHVVAREHPGLDRSGSRW
ncbi:MAG: polyketide synthase dehydratase domain-containing protein [Candidatus Thiodiazotropha sp. (ex Lucinoma aequizonata)]|nr:polyketide synthase dehydratase domain-containing protein [Candidatus Thiodiazotropha sp. (ex Lucinoma aequizonata)]MCU7888962.1 polyketide synthase dehydratase domain-containing protein [Candidatus Thiodiazotropha sp. (ex Lucinoma aequizonata)]MCU7899896.1 polyketide synthase dehydratase domain-containing protein [Candidatus Thiodiazotropha sp. (ex Lucinoma aequizonata)]MCU7902157.1 polyketide synthase dehydratase domain-containing protein [Candidatus Thiodiazotropha sp. (ex Lucinoma aequizo